MSYRKQHETGGAAHKKDSGAPTSERSASRRHAKPLATAPRAKAAGKGPVKGKPAAGNKRAGKPEREQSALPTSRDPLKTLVKLFRSKAEKIRLEAAKITLPYFYDKPAEEQNTDARLYFGALPIAEEFASILTGRMDQAHREASPVPTSDGET